ncbi:TetR/AcrR family transcriptional regulator [Corallococcus sp. 4LFB]|uniref:TetR/AcrR family transcriptional regulator n=1 Tax=Corallococcus sp. 4LFB TaxID=3383249 RepID=UPI0039768D16
MKKSSTRRVRRSDPAPLVKAARALFVQYGVRRTSMEDVARHANVAKGTVYLAFDSKDALFRAVCEDLCDELLARSEEAVGSARTGAERIRARLVAKYAWLQGYVNASPHAEELLASKDSVAGDVLKAMDVRFAKLLAKDLELAAKEARVTLPIDGLEASELARVLMRIARSCGLPDEGRALPTEALAKSRLEALLPVVLRGLRLVD